VRKSGLWDDRGERSKRFWSVAMVAWVVLGVVSLFAQIWFQAAASACMFMAALALRRKAPGNRRREPGAGVAE